MLKELVRRFKELPDTKDYVQEKWNLAQAITSLLDPLLQQELEQLRRKIQEELKMINPQTYLTARVIAKVRKGRSAKTEAKRPDRDKKPKVVRWGELQLTPEFHLVPDTSVINKPANSLYVRKLNHLLRKQKQLVTRIILCQNT